MSSNVPAPDDGIQVSVDLVPFGLPRRRENIAFLRINAIRDTSIGSFMVEGFDAGNGLGSTLHGPDWTAWKQPIFLVVDRECRLRIEPRVI
jgi:hypothetical protein